MVPQGLKEDLFFHFRYFPKCRRKYPVSIKLGTADKDRGPAIKGCVPIGTGKNKFMETARRFGCS